MNQFVCRGDFTELWNTLLISCTVALIAIAALFKNLARIRGAVRRAKRS